MRKLSLLCLMTASAVLLSSCSSVSESSYLGYMKNKLKFGMGVTKQFQQAVRFENVEWLEEFLIQYPDFNVNYYSDEETKYRGYNYETLKVLCSTYSISKNSSEMLEILIKNGLDTNLKFSNGYYGLDLLCSEYTANPYLVKTMLENGADPNNAHSAGFYNMDLGDSKKTTLLLPIYWGIYKPKHTNAEDLLNNGAIVHYEILDKIRGEREAIEGSAKPYQLAFKSYMEKSGESPFTKAEEYAILGESDKLIEELKSGQELDDNTAVNVKYFICRFCNAEALEVWNELYSKRKLSEYKYKKITDQLYAAAYEGNYEVFKCLYNDSLNDFTFNNVLQCAAQAGSYDICKLLLENCNLSEGTNYNELLTTAYRSGNADTFRLIANYLSNKEMLDEIDIYYIFKDQAMEWNQFTKAVIDCLTDDCAFKLNGFECEYIDYETMKYLFEKGKQLSVFDLPMAISSQDLRTVEYVLEQGADTNQGIHSFAPNIYPEENAKLLLPYKESVAALNSNNSDCIKYAIQYGTSEIVQMLIDYNADIGDGSILACAITDSSKATFDVLYNAGASLDYKDDEDKETLLDIAKAMGRDDIVKILKKAGVKSYKFSIF